MRDHEIRKILHTELLQDFHLDPESLVFDEFGLCTGSTRVDIVVVNGALHGFEIKSDQDTLSRLPTQIELYSRVLDFVTLVVSGSHYKLAVDIIPEWWGVIVITESNVHKPLANITRLATKNPSPDPFSISQLLWRQEALLVLEAHGMSKGLTNKSRKFLWKELTNRLPLDELQWIVRNAIKKRLGWRNPTPNRSHNASPFIEVISRIPQQTRI